MKSLIIKSLSVLLIVIAGGCLLSSCKKFVEIDPPETKIDGSTVFSNDQLATSAVIGLYTKIQGSSNVLLNGATTILPALSADELTLTGSNASYDVFLNNAIPSNNNNSGTLWSRGYDYIFQTNIILEGLANSTNITAPVKKQLSGEAKFLRALSHFYLVNLFGDVPLITGTDYKINSTAQRTAVATVYQQIITDLVEAQADLTSSYVTTPSYPTARIRANKWAATALLARVYLYLKKYTEAEVQATAVISSGTYGLVTNLNNVFLAGSNEAILQFMPVGSINTTEGNLFIPTSATTKPLFILTDDLLNAFDITDQRKMNWTKTVTIGTASFTLPFKYKTQTGSSPYAEYNNILRFAEMYLIRAEARANLNNLSGAISDLNLLRSRAQATQLSSMLDQAQVFTAVEQERRLELFAEFGHRWLDLKRTDRANAVLSSLKGTNWQQTDTLYPIPYSQTINTPFLKQNDGY